MPVKPATLSHDSMGAASAGVAPNPAMYAAVERQCRKRGRPGVDTAAAQRAAAPLRCASQNWRVSFVAAGAAPMARAPAVNGATLPDSRTLCALSALCALCALARPASRLLAFACAADPATATVIVVPASTVAAMMLRGDLMIFPCHGGLLSDCVQQRETGATVRSRRGEILNRHATAARDFAPPARCATSALIAYELAVRPP